MIEMEDRRTPEDVLENKQVIEQRIASYHEDAIKCDICEKHHLPEDLKANGDNENVCPSCMGTEECDSCSERFKNDELSELQDINGEVTFEHVCEECKDIAISEAEANATVFYNQDESPHRITDYEDLTEGDFTVKYHRTDGWRGYFDVEPSDEWTPIHSDCILSYSADAEELKKFDDAFQAILAGKGIRYARVFTRTSNVFSTGYDFFVESSSAVEAKAIRVMLAIRFRDPERLRKTAITGKDPDDWDENDNRLMKAVDLLKEGLSPEDAVKKIMEDE